MLRVALATALLPIAAAAPRPATVAHHTVWFRGGEPAPALLITLDLSGFCVGAARSSARPDAWRCFADDHWIDPCFSATSRSRIVLCPIDPWSKSVRIVELTRRLPPVRTRADRKHAPWGIWTANGKRCVISVSGANLVLDGERVRYECAVSGFLVGYANTGGAEWTIGYVPRFALANPRRLHSRRVGITDVWR
jgi:hypothetical protein